MTLLIDLQMAIVCGIMAVTGVDVEWNDLIGRGMYTIIGCKIKVAILLKEVRVWQVKTKPENL